MEKRFTNPLQDNKIYPVRLSVANTMSTSVGGALNNTFILDPSSSSDWANYATIYDEFRVIGVRIRMVSLQQYSVTNANGIGVIVFDNDDTTALTSVQNGLELDTHRIFSAVFQHAALGDDNKDGCLTFVWKRPTSKDSPILWQDIGGPSGSLGAVKLYVGGLQGSTAYLQYAFEWFTEFRGRR